MRGKDTRPTELVALIHVSRTGTVSNQMRQFASRARRVMIVDDHEEIRTFLTRLVRDWGHEVAIAADGLTALSLAEAFQPECAIVDRAMPGINGIEPARRLRSLFPPAQLYLIAFSCYADEDIRDACLAAGFDAYLVKPDEIDKLEPLLGTRPRGF